MLIALPERGIARSVNKHNVDRVALCDWIEASAVFLGAPVTKGEVVDLLVEEQVYNNQDFAAELVDQLWMLLRESTATLGYNSLTLVDGRSVRATTAWRDRSPTAFFLLLSIAPNYPRVRDRLSDNYAEQGSLFEAVAAEALSARGWSVFGTGWKAGISNQSFLDIVNNVADFLQEPGSTNGVASLLTRANDAGLDLVCVWPFLESAPMASPSLLMQCASGANWTTKLKTPDLETWTRLIPFVVHPTRAMVIPFRLSQQEFNKRAFDHCGVLVDRLRLLNDLGPPTTWASFPTRSWLTEWVEVVSSVLEPAE